MAIQKQSMIERGAPQGEGAAEVIPSRLELPTTSKQVSNGAELTLTRIDAGAMLDGALAEHARLFGGAVDLTYVAPRQEYAGGFIPTASGRDIYLSGGPATYFTPAPKAATFLPQPPETL